MKKKLLLSVLFTLGCCWALNVALAGPPAGNLEPVKNYKWENRCGWFDNPTPGNAWLTDRDGEWTIGTQGGHQAEGDWPAFKRGQWVKTNGSYGYGCACMEMQADHETREVAEIRNAKARPLSSCRNDRALPKRR